MKNTKKNRGFSLVELIVVVAIMAVLVGVLAPSLLRYVEKTRAQKDESAIAEVIEAVKIECATESVAKDVVNNTTVTITNGSIVSSVAALKTAVNVTIPDTAVSLTSSAHKNQKYTITLTVDTNGITVPDYAAANWADVTP